MLPKHDSNVADKWYVPDDAPDDVLPVEIVLAARVEFRVVGIVVVALGQQLGVRTRPELAHDAMHDGYVLPLDVVDYDIADVGLGYQVAIPQEQEVAALEGGFHGPGKDDDNGGGRVGGDREALPHL